ncbi:MAG TPA: hypothetical protein PKM25_17560, partial [Candidatus Ozemobacteraceae bacterium]|nr:hypothetical protein [Candidatus Ozemobacteraceae bacterium]
FWRSTGLKGIPRFDSLVLEGGRLLEAKLTSASETQNIAMNISKLRIRRGKKTWWVDDVAMKLATDEPLDRVRGLPSRLTADAALKLFGFPGTVHAVLNLAESRMAELAVSWRGDDFGTLLTALREHPDIDEAIRKYQIDLGGAFTLKVNGSGLLNRPSLSGSVAFPRLDLKAGRVSAAMPCDLSLSMGNDGEYRGDISTKNAKISVRGVDFVLDGLHSQLSWGRSKGSKAQMLKLNGTTRVFDTILDLESSMEPAARRIRSLKLKGQSRRLQTLMGEIARIGKFNLPFTVNGPADVEFIASGSFDALTAKAAADIAGLDLRLPLHIASGRIFPVDITGISGHIEFAQTAPGRFSGSITNGRAEAAGGMLALSGKARLEKEGGKFTPLLDDLSATLENLDAAKLMQILNGGFLPVEIAGKLTDVAGKLSGRLNLGGGRNRYGGQGEVTIAGGGFRWAGIPEPVRHLDAKLVLSRRQGRPEPVVEWQGVKAMFGRSTVSIPSGRLIDPQNTAKLSLEGVI